MKKINLITLLLIVNTVIFAQEKGSFLTLSAGVGPTKFNYELKGIDEMGRNKVRIGGLGTLGYSYFFSENWGISTGVGISYYSTSGKYTSPFSKDRYFSLGNQIDDDNVSGINRSYELRARLANWEEIQTGYFIEIPLLVNFQHKFGDDKRHGIYASVGAKVQMPVQSKFKVKDNPNSESGGLNVSAYYGSTQQLELGIFSGADIFEHGFGVVHNPNERLGWNDEIDIKTSLAVTGEFGFLIGLSKRVELTVGGFIDYGLLNIKKENKELMQMEGSYLPQANNNPGKGITYNGMVNSNRTDRTNLFAGGVKVGVRIKLGKLKEVDTLPRIHDTIYIHTKEEIIITDTMKTKALEEALEKMQKTLQDLLNERMKNVEEDDGLTNEQRVLLKETIFFDLGKSTIKPEGYSVLDRKVQFMKDNPDLRIRIIGNTCDIGGDRINAELGFQRAESVRQYMIRKGINPTRIVSASQASNDPLLPNINEENRTLNRRVDFEIDNTR